MINATRWWGIIIKILYINSKLCEHRLLHLTYHSFYDQLIVVLTTDDESEGEGIVITSSPFTYEHVYMCMCVCIYVQVVHSCHVMVTV